MWKFQDESVTQILREIDFDDCRSYKSFIFVVLDALKFQFLCFLAFKNSIISYLKKIQRPQKGKTAVFKLLQYLKLISRKK